MDNLHLTLSKNGTILIVDQDSALASILASYLTCQDFRVLFTTRIREAKLKIRNQRFVHIFVDPELPPDDGLELLYELIRSNSVNARTSITLMTSNKDFLLSMSIVKRIHSVLTKPFTLEEFAFRMGERPA